MGQGAGSPAGPVGSPARRLKACCRDARPPWGSIRAKTSLTEVTPRSFQCCITAFCCVVLRVTWDWRHSTSDSLLTDVVEKSHFLQVGERLFSVINVNMKLLSFSELRVLSCHWDFSFQLLSLLLLLLLILINQSWLCLFYAKEQNIIWDLMVLCQPQVCSLMK